MAGGKNSTVAGGSNSARPRTTNGGEGERRSDGAEAGGIFGFSAGGGDTVVIPAYSAWWAATVAEILDLKNVVI